MARRVIIERSLADRGALILTRDLDEACAIADRIAPEHLEISTDDPEHWAAKIRHAGALFLGRHTSEALGDYCAGPNHVLPTARTARFSSPLGVYDFQKRTSLVRVSEAGAQTLGRIAATLARGEQLPGARGERRIPAEDTMSTRPNLDVLRDDVRAIDAYAVPSATGLIKLDAMENPFPLPPGLMQQLGNRIGRTPLNRYPQSDPKGFKERLARAMGMPEGMQLMLGNGSDELIHLVIQACARPDAVVLSPAPSFVMYEMSARFNRCRFVAVPLQADFTIDGDALLAAIEEHSPRSCSFRIRTTRPATCSIAR